MGGCCEGSGVVVREEACLGSVAVCQKWGGKRGSATGEGGEVVDQGRVLLKKGGVMSMRLGV